MSDLMWNWLCSFPQQLRHAAQLGAAWDLSGLRPVRGICFLGIGGSAIGAELICNFYGGSFAFPVVVSRGARPPSWLGEGSLAVAISYSGETRETLKAFERALAKGAQGASISSGGVLAEMAHKRALPHLLIPPKIAPRAALGYTSLPLIALLRQLKAIPDAEIDVNDAASTLESLQVVWKDAHGEGASIAQALRNHFPIIIGGGICAVVARRLQAQLAENAKTISNTFELPEALHNLVETLRAEHLQRWRPKALFLQDSAAEDINAMMKCVQEALQASGLGGEITIQAQGQTSLTRLFSLIHKADWISYHLAKLKGVDPVAINIIESIKIKLQR